MNQKALNRQSFGDSVRNLRKKPESLLLLLAAFAPIVLTEFNLYLLTTILIYALITLGLNVLLGYSGQVSIGHAAFLAIGAYATAIGAERYALPMLLLIVGAGLLAGAAGWLLGRPATRLTGHYLAVATLGFAIIVEKALFELPELTGGRNGMAVPMLKAFGVDLGQGLQRYIFVVVIVAGVFLFTAGVLNSRVGRGWIALKGSPVAAASAGINLARYRSNAFVFSAVLTGMAGALYAAHVGFLSSEAFNLKLSLVFLIAVVVGGMGSIAGSLLGAAFAVLVPHFLADYAQAQEVVFGCAIILVVLVLPRGLVQIAEWRHRDDVREQSDAAGAALEQWQAPESWSREQTERAVFSAIDVSIAFAGVRALQNVSFEVPSGVAVGVMGPNGAGKTTLFNILSGIYQPDEGAVRFGDTDLTRMPPHKRTDVGVARCFQEALLFDELSTLDNLMVGADSRCSGGIVKHGIRARRARARDRELRGEALRTLELLGLSHRASTPARDYPSARGSLSTSGAR